MDNSLFIAILVLVFLLGAFSSSKMEQYWGKDNGKIVIDEVLGMGVSILWLPFRLEYYIAAFILFRVLDIWKPLFIRKTEKLKGGWGVMADDALAGIYTLLLLHSLILICDKKIVECYCFSNHSSPLSLLPSLIF
jgi:phosphatidylglycerophosphatase A